MKEIFVVPYGSHLYGTSTPTSDLDSKTIYLPDLDDVLLGKKLSIFKMRFDGDGIPLGVNDAMPPGGIENEYIPLQTFVRDFFNGQTYALEVAFAHLHIEENPFLWVTQLTQKFVTNNVSSLVGFAIKQTFDYVHRGKRLNAAELLLQHVTDTQNALIKNGIPNPRLDTSFNGTTVLDTVTSLANAQIGQTQNNGKVFRTLKLNGRDYLETTTLQNITTTIRALIDSYGNRSRSSAGEGIDTKSLMHAVRVFEQAIELLTTKKIEFPRKNADYLRSIKNSTVPIEVVKDHLIQLEEQVELEKKFSTLLPEKTPELEHQFEQWQLALIKKMYSLN